MQIIDNWLKGKKSFIAGVILYKQLGKNERLKELLAGGETPFLRKELETALAKLMKEGVKAVAPPALSPETDVMPDSADVILKALKDEWMPPYLKMNLLRHELDKYGKDNGWEAIAYRKDRANEIKELEQVCMKVWAKKDYYEKHGKLPFVEEVKMDIPEDPEERSNMIEGIKKNIRRNRFEMKKPGADASFAKRYEEYKVKYKEVSGKEYVEKN